jgi:hypothetical protein
MEYDEVEEGRPLVDPLGQAFEPPAKPAKKDESVSYLTLKKVKQRLYSQTVDCLTATLVVAVVCGGCFVSYMFCQPCLFGLMLLSACMCPWLPYFNIPLWISIIMLVALGWHFTAGSMTLAWH